jgi:hypothetical protein
MGAPTSLGYSSTPGNPAEAFLPVHASIQGMQAAAQVMHLTTLLQGSS